VQPVFALAAPPARIGCGACGAGRNRFAPAPRVAHRLAPRPASRLPRLPAACALRADVAPRPVRAPPLPVPIHRKPYAPRMPAPPRACASVLLGAGSHAHV